jgi:kinesin family protein 11
MSSTTETQKKNLDTKEGVNIQVILRCRPANKEESSSEICVKTSSKEVLVTQKLVSGKPSVKAFTFDHVYGPGSTQKELFESIKPLIEEVLMGYNCTIFAYGQTSTGKTYTMEGRRNDKAEIIPNEEGIVPRSIDYIFEHLKKINAEYSIRLSCLELYNEDLQDLLANEKKGLRLYDDPNGRGTTINGLEEVVVKDIKDLLQILDIAAKKRQVGETQLNKASSRSHVITTFTSRSKHQMEKNLSKLVNCTWWILQVVKTLGVAVQ